MSGEADARRMHAEARRLESRLGEEALVIFAGAAACAIAVVAAGAPWLPALGPLAAFATAVLAFRLKQHDDALGRLRERVEEERARAVALLAEVADNIAQAQRTYAVVSFDGIMRRMEENDAYTPFFVWDEAPGLVYRALLGRLGLLPQRVVEATIGYYEADAGLTTALATLRKADFLALPSASRRVIVRAVGDLLDEIYRPNPSPRAGGASATSIAETARVTLAGHAARCDDAIRDLAARQERSVLALIGAAAGRGGRTVLRRWLLEAAWRCRRISVSARLARQARRLRQPPLRQGRLPRFAQRVRRREG